MSTIHLPITKRDRIDHRVKNGVATLVIENTGGLYVTLSAASDATLASLAAHIELMRTELHAAEFSRSFGEGRAS